MPDSDDLAAAGESDRNALISTICKYKLSHALSLSPPFRVYIYSWCISILWSKCMRWDVLYVCARVLSGMLHLKLIMRALHYIIMCRAHSSVRVFVFNFQFLTERKQYLLAIMTELEIIIKSISMDICDICGYAQCIYAYTLDNSALYC